MDLTDDWGGPYAKCDLGKETPLCHSLLSVQEVARSVHGEHHQSSPVAISAEGKLQDTRPLKLDGPQHCHMILLVDRVLHINEE